jgi:hypothetical protein
MADEEQPLTGGAAEGINRVRSIEQPLAGPALSDVAGTHTLVPSSLDSDKICRYCLEDNDEEVDPFHPDHLIAPCQCRGSSRWVHRGCLDEWRATRSDRAFSACTECHFTYEFVEPHAEEAQAEEGCKREKLRLKFQVLVARDVVKVFLGMQLAILFLGGFIRSVDCDLDDGIGWWDCANVTEAELVNMTAEYRYHEGMGADLSACCPAGDIVNSWALFKPLKDHSRSAYYLVGLLVFCLIYGCVVSKDWRGGMCGDGSADACCFGFCGSEGSRGTGGYLIGVCMGMCQCVASGGGVAGFCMFMLLVCCVLVLVFTIAGALAAAMALSVAVQRAIQRHVHVLHRRDMATQFVVEDLCGDGGCRSLAEVLAERGGVEPMTSARTSVGNRAVLSQQDVQQRLRDAGVAVAETPTPQMWRRMGLADSV